MDEKEYTITKSIFSKSELDFKTVFDLSKVCSKLLGNKETEHMGRDLVIRALDVWDKIPESAHTLWNDIIEAAGLYPYTKIDKLGGAALLRQEFHRSDFLKDKFLHSEQVGLSHLLHNSEQSLIVSAPTSFGKSLLIEELVASKKYNNIVVIQPTLALLDETRKKLQKYSKDYNIVVATTQPFHKDKRNLFLFTGERVVEYPEFPKVDFFVVDEFYKLSMERDDERATSLNEAVYRLLKITKRFYMLGPNIKSISEGFSSTYDAHWEKTNYATVAVDIEKLFEKFSDESDYFTFVPLDKEKMSQINIDHGLREQLFTGSLETDLFFKKNAVELIQSIPAEYKSIKIKLKNIYKEAKEEGELFNLLLTLTEPTLIYCSSPNKTFRVVNRFISFLKKRGISDLKLPTLENIIIDWIEENIDKDWILAHALQYSVAIHNGIIPRHLSSSIVDAFNNGKIRYLFCTSTLIEGVNTSTKNVVLLDKMKGPKPIDYFDFKNISGRTGRMNQHFVGRVFQFHKEPKQEEIEVDIPLFTQTNAPIELLVQIDQKDIKQVAEKKLDKFKQLEPSIQELVKKNKGVPIDGQLKILEILERDFESSYEMLFWRGIPKYPQLKYIAELGWTYLLKKGESKGGLRSAKQLATFTLQYCQHKSIRALVAMNYRSDYWTEQFPNDDQRLQIIINTTLQATQHWFSYKFPKLLAVISDLQKYICEKKGVKSGDYSALAGMIEHSFIPPHLAILSEYGIPSSAISKINLKIKEELSLEDIIKRLKTINPNDIGLIPYEVIKIQSLIDGYQNLEV